MISTDSEVGIANIALARLGADSIRDFNENNKRARLSKTLYDYCRDYLLTKYNWSFARTTKILQLKVSAEDVIIPVNANYTVEYIYGIPSDCMAPIEMRPAGKQNRWEIIGEDIHSNIPPLFTSEDSVETLVGPVLIFTILQTDPKKFNAPFTTALTELLALKLAPGIVQDKTVASAMVDEVNATILMSIDEDANLGNNYRNDMEEPDLDPFVTGHDLNPQWGAEGEEYAVKRGIGPW